MVVNSEFKEILDDLKEAEGGFSDHESDRGGPTNHGITIRTLSIHLGRPATYDDVKNLTLEEARSIYVRSYILNPGIDRLPKDLIPLVFDFAVNSGPRNAIISLQKSLQGLGYAISADGLIGNETIKACVSAIESGKVFFINLLVANRNSFYYSIVERDKSQNAFLDGWLKRSKKFLVDPSTVNDAPGNGSGSDQDNLDNNDSGHSDGSSYEPPDPPDYPDDFDSDDSSNSSGNPPDDVSDPPDPPDQPDQPDPIDDPSDDPPIGGGGLH